MSSKSTPAQKKSKVKVVFGLAERLPGSVAFPSLLSMELINEKPHGTLWGRVVNEPKGQKFIATSQDLGHAHGLELLHFLVRLYI